MSARLSRRLGLIATTVITLSVCTGAAGQVSFPTLNLLRNPGADDAPGAADERSKAPPPGWAVTSSFTALQYGTTTFPSKDERARIRGGKNFFAGGPESAESTATQRHDVSSLAVRIDAGSVVVELSGFLGGWQSQEDFATADLVFFDRSGVELGRLRIGPVTAAARANQTKLLPRSKVGRIPKRTRTITIKLTAVRRQGSYNDGYLDRLYLRLLKHGPCANDWGIRSHFQGTNAGDKVQGGDGVQGGDDPAFLSGLGGDDCLYGGGGNDELSGGSGSDIVEGGSGRDYLKSRDFNVLLEPPEMGFDGFDRFFGGPGGDRIDSVDGGRDLVRCGPGRDRVRADKADQLRGCERKKRV